MGLWKKKSPAPQRRDPLQETELYQWSTQSYTLKEIISTFKLPCVVQCSADSCSVLWSKFQFDLKQPLLLYSVRSVSKIFVRTVRTDKNSGKYVEFGPPLVIPEDYQGWFVTVSEDEVPQRYTKIEHVAESEGDYFLSATKVPAFTRTIENNTSGYSQQYLNAGDVLRKDGFINGPLDAPSHSNFSAKDKHHLRCVDSKEEEYIVPFSHRGIFYDVSTDIQKTSAGVFNTTQIMATGGSTFPMVLRHIQGELPALNYSFTGFLECNHIFSEQTVVACSLNERGPIPLELACKSKIRFSIALNDIDFKARNAYVHALDFCNHDSEKYARAIKVSFTLKPEMSTLEELDFALYDTGSDVEDVDAQSEFDFWDPDDNESKEALEILVQSKQKEASAFLGVNVGENVVDIGTPYELENNVENLVIKKAAEYTASVESHGSDQEDVTVDSSLFEDSQTDQDVTMESVPNGDDGPNHFSEDHYSLGKKCSTEKPFEFVGNLKTAIPGRILKDEVIRTSSGNDAEVSANKFVDWGPEIPSNTTSKIAKVTLNDKAIRNNDDHSVMNGPISDSQCVIDHDKDLSGRLTSYRSISSLNKIDFDENGFCEEMSFDGNDVIDLSDGESCVAELETTVSESEFIIKNENDTSDTCSISSEISNKNVQGSGNLNKEDNDTVKKGVMLGSNHIKLETYDKRIIDMSLEEAAV